MTKESNVPIFITLEDRQTLELLFKKWLDEDREFIIKNSTVSLLAWLDLNNMLDKKAVKNYLEEQRTNIRRKHE